MILSSVGPEAVHPPGGILFIEKKIRCRSGHVLFSFGPADAIRAI